MKEINENTLIIIYRTKRGVAREKYSPSCNGSQNSLADFDSHMNSMSSSMTSEKYVEC